MRLRRVAEWWFRNEKKVYLLIIAQNFLLSYLRLGEALAGKWDPDPVCWVLMIINSMFILFFMWRYKNV